MMEKNVCLEKMGGFVIIVCLLMVNIFVLTVKETLKNMVVVAKEAIFCRKFIKRVV